MTPEELLWTLNKIGIYKYKPTTKGYVVSCPLASTRHKKGTDRRPSMVVFTTPPHTCYCFSCLFKGPVEELVRTFGAVAEKDIGTVTAFVEGSKKGDPLVRAKTLRDYDEVLNAVRYSKDLTRTQTGAWKPIRFGSTANMSFIEGGGRSEEFDRERHGKLTQEWSKNGWCGYFRSRGVHRTTVLEWNLGFDSKGYEVEREKRGEKYIVNFGPRVIFPVYNDECEFVGWSGRTIINGEKTPRWSKVRGVSKCVMLGAPKYYHANGFRKAHYLYGECKRDENNKTAILVEGFMDVINVWQHGFKNVFAIMGADLSGYQAQKLRRWAERVIVIPDGDEAGALSASKSKEQLEKLGLQVTITDASPGRDPGDMLQEELAKLISY